MRRPLLTGAVAIALLTATPAPAKADLSFGELMDGFEWFLGELMKTRGLAAFADQLAAMLALFGIYIEPELADTYPEDPTIYSPDQSAARADARYQDRIAQTTEATEVAGQVAEQVPWTQLQLTAMRVANRNPYSIFYALQLGNEGTFMMTEEVSKTNMLLAEMAQVELNQHAAEDWQAKQSVALTEERFGDGHGLWNGMKTWQPTPLVREW